jgi:hypothetical protein
MTSTTLPPIESLRPGRFVSASGELYEFTEADLADMAASYDPALFRAPIVVGHPKANHPAYGWVAGLQYDAQAQRLRSVPTEVEPQFAELVRAGQYRKVSVSLYTPTAKDNPAPGHYYLKHLGFLGAAAPAVKGLREVVFAEAVDGIIDLSGYEDMTQAQAEAAAEAPLAAAFPDAPESQPGDTIVTDKTAEFAEREMALAAREAEIAAREQKIQKAEASAKRQSIAEFAESLVQQGKVLPRDKDGLIEFMAAIDGEQVIEFGEGDGHVKAQAGSWILDFLRRLPKQVEFSEVSGGAVSETIDFADPAAIARAATAYQAQQRQAGVEVSDIEAVIHITKPRS